MVCNKGGHLTRVLECRKWTLQLDHFPSLLFLIYLKLRSEDTTVLQTRGPADPHGHPAALTVPHDDTPDCTTVEGLVDFDRTNEDLFWYRHLRSRK